ncbi:MAG: hypothetical protein OEM05_00525 [Myxococcales bacterium]|nr:hypothetical protein [Myxococcales bacterium]
MSGGGRRVLDAVLETLVPEGGAFPEGAPTFPLAERVEEFVRGAGAGTAFRLLLYGIELYPLLLPRLGRRRFSRLPLEKRERVLAAWEASRFWPRRQALHALKMIVLSQFYGQPEIHARLGYPHPLARVPIDDLPAPRETP